jgi:hypothetical protein
MRAGVKFAAALVCAASLGCAAQGQAAVVVQTKTFHHLRQALATDRDTVNHVARLNASESSVTAVHFDPFNPGLGTLTNARLVLSSDQAFDFGVSVVGFGVAGLTNAAYTSAVRLGGSALGGLSSAFSSNELPPCRTATAGICLVQLGNYRTFGFDLAGLDLSPFLAAGRVDLELGSTISLTGAPSFLQANALLTEIGVLDWNGTLSLNYTYDPARVGPPASVPEPAAWALVIAGFALAGARLRRRRAVGYAV